VARLAIDINGRNGIFECPGKLMPRFACFDSPGPFTTTAHDREFQLLNAGTTSSSTQALRCAVALNLFGQLLEVSAALCAAARAARDLRHKNCGSRATAESAARQPPLLCGRARLGASDSRESCRQCPPGGAVQAGRGSNQPLRAHSRLRSSQGAERSSQRAARLYTIDQVANAAHLCRKNNWSLRNP